MGVNGSIDSVCTTVNDTTREVVLELSSEDPSDYLYPQENYPKILGRIREGYHLKLAGSIAAISAFCEHCPLVEHIERSQIDSGKYRVA